MFHLNRLYTFYASDITQPIPQHTSLLRLTRDP